MRVNLPITQQQYDYDPAMMLVSTTDPKGRITYANPAFIAVSGFTKEELIGKAHNMVRHPDMPSEAYADMWATIQSGKPWTALVKNRRKNGDHYWVSANVTPIQENGVVTGYMSVRVKPNPENVKAASRLYQDFREGRAQHLAFRQGHVVRKGLLGRVDALKRLSLRAQIYVAMAFVVAAGAAALLALPALPLLSVATSFVAAWLAGLVLNVKISAPIGRALLDANRIAGCDLSSRAEVTRQDEIGQLQQALTQTTVNMMALVYDVKQQVSSIRTASSEIAIGNGDLASRTEQTASNLEQTSAAMEQLTATVAQNADAAGSANQLAASASAVASRGGKMIEDVVVTMDTISKSSHKIADIISLIDGIAFQTNILALNAAVEAARAGEQGRGFAVVASEVRSLAKRSADAAKEIKQLIDASATSVDSGAAQVGSAGKTMHEIVKSVQDVNTIIAQITTATHEQSVGITEVNDAVSQLDEMTQQNAALVEQSAAAAESLKEQADRLTEAIAVFKV
jgi:aerotaxis receptor